MQNKVLTLLGFAKKSGNLVSGVNTCTFNLGRKKVKLMILAEDISEGSEKKIMKEIRKAGVEYIKYGNIDELSHITGGSGRSVFAILDENFANSIKKEAVKEQ
ncbi:MAG: ribosomal L7Ae/L30e/S12e/Gadd45 family protein [Bacillota bacterium]|nr:ribosomal L7Ae/L30e/S12e/Gadd45 family protein [Bacillota bacterium]